MQKLNNIEVENDFMIYRFQHLEVFISPCQIQEDGHCIYFLVVIDKNTGKSFSLYFRSLEEAIKFTKNCVAESVYVGDVINKYKESASINNDKNTLAISDAIVTGSIISYYSMFRGNRPSVHKELSIQNDEVKVRYYVLPNLKNIKDCESVNREYLSETDIANAINGFLIKLLKKVERFEPIGGIRRVGYYVDEDTPYFEGFAVSTKDLVQNEDFPLNKKPTSAN